MFTSISWRIFEEARSKRVWSISSTFEYVPPFPPSIFLRFALSLSASLFRIYLNNPQSFAIFLRGRLASEKSRGKRDARKGKELSGLGSFQKCLAETRSVKGNARADNVDLPKDTRLDATRFSLLLKFFILKNFHYLPPSFLL